MAAPEAGGGGLSRGGLAAIIVVACIVGLSLLAAAALVVRRRQVCSLDQGAKRGLASRALLGTSEAAVCSCGCWTCGDVGCALPQELSAKNLGQRCVAVP